MCSYETLNDFQEKRDPIGIFRPRPESSPYLCPETTCSLTFPPPAGVKHTASPVQANVKGQEKDTAGLAVNTSLML